MGVGDRESGVEGFKNENIETAAEKAWRDQTRGVLIREAVQEHSGGGRQDTISPRCSSTKNPGQGPSSDFACLLEKDMQHDFYG